MRGVVTLPTPIANASPLFLAHRTGLLFSLHSYNNPHLNYTPIIKSITVHIFPRISASFRGIPVTLLRRVLAPVEIP
jgi:hypothetical protein